MQDITLWELLRDGTLSTSEQVERACALLDALSERSIAERSPFFGLLPVLLSHPDPRLVQGAVRVLAGAQGATAFMWLVDALNSPHEATAREAVIALRASARSDPARWAHALFHPNVAVRRTAVAQAPELDSDGYRLCLLLDEHTAAQVRAALPRPLPAPSVSLVMQLFGDGALSAAEARELIDGFERSTLLEFLYEERARSDASARAVVSARADPAQIAHRLASDPAPDLLDQVLALHWDDSPATAAFFDELDAFVTQDRQRTAWLLAALIATAHRHGRWSQRAAGSCCLFFPRMLAMEWIPRPIRRGALATVHTAREQLKPRSDEEIDELLSLEITRHEGSGLPDLWVIGALLHFVDKKPYALAIERYGLEALADGFLVDPKEAAIFFCIADDSKPGRKALIACIRKRSPSSLIRSLALLVFVVSADRLSFLANLKSNAVLELVVTIMELEAEPEFSLNRNKVRRLTEWAAPLLDENTLVAFLQRWLPMREATRSALGLSLLETLAEALGGDAFVRVANTLTPELQASLCKAIDASSGFPYGCESLLAQAWHSAPDPALREWARLHELISSPRTTIADSGVTAIPVRDLARIARASDAKCSDEVERLAGFPNTGLTEALSRRALPAAPMPEVCLALLLCHDPSGDVAREFARFDGATDAFRSGLDREMVARCRGNKSLPLLGNAWLHLWEPHCFAAVAQLEAAPEGLAAVLVSLPELASIVLQEQIVRSVARAIAIYRYRDRGRLEDLASEALIDALIALLTAPALDLPVASALSDIHRAGVVDTLLDARRETVMMLLPDIEAPARERLSAWIDSSGLVAPARSAPVVSPSALEQLLSEIAQADDPQALEPYCRSEHERVVEEAALRLLELDEPGQAVIARVIEMRLDASDPVHHLRSLIETVSLWSDGAALERVRAIAFAASGDPEVRFASAGGLLERVAPGAAADALLENMLAAVRDDAGAVWFTTGDWQRLMRFAPHPERFARAIVTSPQPAAYLNAVNVLLGGSAVGDDVASLVAFLRCGTERMHTARAKVARWLAEHGDFTGFPILLHELFRKQGSSLAGFEPLARAEATLVTGAVVSALAAGTKLVDERVITDAVGTVDDPALRERARLTLLDGCTLLKTQQQLVQQIRRSQGVTERIQRLAESFAWGVRLGLELTGRLFRVVMQGGAGLGYTRLDENRIYITPLPILRAEPHGEDLVQGLILHEFGHHMYHAGSAGEAVWKEAESEQLAKLLNLVADEHLERNLRARDAEFGDRLKRLAAYAFQHAFKDVDVDYLLFNLGTRAFAVLSAMALGVSKQRGAVVIESGRLLMELENTGSSFARFMRALRMGLGDRHRDPKVAEALALFKGRFRNASMPRLLEITRELRRIFGAECCLLDVLDEHDILDPSEGEICVVGEGLSDEELEQQVQRVLGGESSSEKSAAGSARMLNIGPNETFTPITTVVPVPFDRTLHARYASVVAPYARAMRLYLERMGLAHHDVKFRTRGHRVDQNRLVAGLLKSDPRIMVARRLEVRTDLFIGLLVDCSGSMVHRDNIERGKLFATLVAEACKRLPGVDMRVFGFNDAVLFDAGRADRCAAHSLEADGGNNDAAALWHAANLARASRRRAKVLIMVSDGLPTQCTVAALQALVHRLTRRWGMVCAQVAVEPLEVVCFPHYVLLEERSDMAQSVRQFGDVVMRLVSAALRAG